MIERETTGEARAVPALSTGVLAPVAGAGRWLNRFARTKPLCSNDKISQSSNYAPRFRIW